MVTFKAKDIFRASRLNLLGIKNKHVDKNMEKIGNAEELSPILLVRDPLSNRVIIADGYHRLSAVYALSEDADIPCKIVWVPSEKLSRSQLKKFTFWEQLRPKYSHQNTGFVQAFLVKGVVACPSLVCDCL